MFWSITSLVLSLSRSLTSMRSQLNISTTGFLIIYLNCHCPTVFRSYWTTFT